MKSFKSNSDIKFNFECYPYHVEISRHGVINIRKDDVCENKVFKDRFEKLEQAINNRLSGFLFAFVDSRTVMMINLIFQEEIYRLCSTDPEFYNFIKPGV